MAVSFPVPEVHATILGHVAPPEEGPAVKASRLAGADRVLQHLRARLCSAIFDADGDCMHL